MSSYLKISAEDLVAIQSLLQQVSDPVHKKRLQALLYMASERATTEIVKNSGFSRITLCRYKAKYQESGLQWFKSVYRSKGGCNFLLTKEDEAAIFKYFHTLAQAGHTVTANDVRKAIEEKIGKPISRGTVYLMLERNGWGEITRRK